MARVYLGGLLSRRLIRLAADSMDLEVCPSSDVEAALRLKVEDDSYYIGICATGSGSAIAVLQHVLGWEVCCTLAVPGEVFDRSRLDEALENGCRVFGLPLDQAAHMIPIVLRAIKSRLDSGEALRC